MKAQGPEIHLKSECSEYITTSTNQIEEVHEVFAIFTLCFSSVVTLFHCGLEDLHIVL